MEQILADIFCQCLAAEWLEKLRAAGTPCSPVQTLPEVVEHRQAVFREMFPTVAHPTAGPHRVTGAPIKLSMTPGRPTVGASLLGEHTRFALADLLALDALSIDQLVASGIIFR